MRLLAESINGAQHEDYVARVFGRSVTAKPYCVKSTFGILNDLLPQNSISKMRSDIEQTRLIVCERPLQEHTHTSALVTTPRATENDAPKYSVYVCVVCVGGSRSNDNIVLGQSKEYFFPNESPIVPNTTPRQENRSP